jgi:hypothetical protein
VRKSFVRVEADGEPGNVAPLFRLYRGGRSGIVPIRLYLALLWRSAASPYASAKTYEGWATLLGLEDPRGKGSRRVARAVAALEAESLIAVDEDPGHPSLLTVLREDGSGSRYQPPGDAYVKAVTGRRGKTAAARHRYFKINSALWTSGRLQDLSGPALVMLLILLAEQAGEGKEVWFSTQTFKDWYGLSAPTRAAGVKELEEKGLLNVDHRSLGAFPGTTVYDPKRKRHVYTLTDIARTDTPVVQPKRRDKKLIRRAPAT